jgi:hypothetical protein|tara:strand:- start:422 stop:616 length:195 start_codon:yes stop_codon:yes gene_type:complete
MEIKMIIPGIITLCLWALETPLWLQVIPFSMWGGYYFIGGFKWGWAKRSTNIKDYLPPKIKNTK